MEKEQNVLMRGRAASYAKTFLAQKYKAEYSELYQAYLSNRGVTTMAGRGAIIDERLVHNE